jgi:signal transduction histidine kinase
VRRRLSVLVAATTSAVVLAFLIPLALVLRTLAEDRAVAEARLQSQALLLVAGSNPDAAHPTAAVQSLVGDLKAGRTTLYLPNGGVIGPAVADPGVDQARTSKDAWITKVVDNQAVVYGVSIGSSGTLVARTEVSRAKFHDGVAQATATIAGLGMVMLLAAMFAADRLGRWVAAPIRDLALAAKKMRDGHLDVRIPERGPPEVVALGTALTQLATRVQQLLAAERDAVADLSHRLRTPVTALRLDTDSIADPEVADRLRQHVAQLERTVDAIVHDARRPTRAGGNACDVTKVVGQRVAFWSALAEEQGRELRMAVPDRPLRARLDAADLSDVVDVLIDNVFAHTDEGVPLEVWVVPRADGAVVLTVEDGGAGLPQEDVVARGSSGAGSTGLGMDIARRAANASGGSLELGRSRLGGALVRVVLGAADR